MFVQVYVVDICVFKLRIDAYEMVIRLDNEVEEKYLTVSELGKSLQKLSDSIEGKVDTQIL